MTPSTVPAVGRQSRVGSGSSFVDVVQTAEDGPGVARLNRWATTSTASGSGSELGTGSVGGHRWQPANVAVGGCPNGFQTVGVYGIFGWFCIQNDLNGLENRWVSQGTLGLRTRSCQGIDVGRRAPAER